MKAKSAMMNIFTKERISGHPGSPSRRNRRIVQFILLAVAADVGFICVELTFGLNPLADMVQRPFLYLYVFLGTIATFGVFGAMVGSREDLLEAMALRDSLTGLFNALKLDIHRSTIVIPDPKITGQESFASPPGGSIPLPAPGAVSSVLPAWRDKTSWRRYPHRWPAVKQGKSQPQPRGWRRC